MIKDKLGREKQIFRGDTVYVYQYKDRNKISSINDLEKIVVEDISESGGGDFIASGTKSYLDSNGRIQEEKTSGIVCYVMSGNMVVTSEGEKIINYYVDDNKIKLCLRKPKEEYEYMVLNVLFQIDKKIELTVKPYDIICVNENNLKSLISLIKISHPRLHNGFVSFFLNDNEVVTRNVEVYINKTHYIGNNGLGNVFDWAVENKNPLTDSPYKFQKIYSLKHTGYIASKIQI